MNKVKKTPILFVVALMFVAQNAHSAFVYLQDGQTSSGKLQASKREVLPSNVSSQQGLMPVLQSYPQADYEIIDNPAIYQQGNSSSAGYNISSSTQVIHDIGLFSYKGIDSMSDTYNDTYLF